MATITKNDLNLISEILEAVAYFIKRQQFVVQVIKDLDIDPIDMGRWGSGIWTQQGKQHPSPNLSAPTSDAATAVWEAIERARSRRAVNQTGKWGKSEEWDYFLHGKGCMLRNSLTGEEIDWDCPNPQRFNRYFFLEHLRWRIKMEKDNLIQIRKKAENSPNGLDFIIQALEEMVEAGLINRDYTLPNQSSPENQSFDGRSD
jgi:hypothetical protein